MIKDHMRRVMRKPAYAKTNVAISCLVTAQLINHTADQCLCFCYIDSIIPLLSKAEISSLLSSSVAVQPGLCHNLEDRFFRDMAHFVKITLGR